MHLLSARPLLVRDIRAWTPSKPLTNKVDELGMHIQNGAAGKSAFRNLQLFLVRLLDTPRTTGAPLGVSHHAMSLREFGRAGFC